jgi:hypothetical protein
MAPSYIDDLDDDKLRETAMFHGIGLVEETMLMLDLVEEGMESALSDSNVLDDVIKEAKQKGVFFKSAFIGKLFTANKSGIEAYKDFFSSIEKREPPKTCGSSTWFRDNKEEECYRIATSQATIQLILKASMLKIKNLVESGNYEDANDLLLSMKLSEYEIISASGGNNVTPDAFVGMLNSVTDHVYDKITLGTRSNLSDDNEVVLWTNPYIHTQEIGENLLWASLTLSSVAVGIAGAVGAASSVPFLGTGIASVWDFADGFVASINTLLFTQGVIMKYGTQILLFLITFMISIRWVLRFVIGIIACNGIPVMLMMPGEGILGNRMEKLFMMTMSLLIRPFIDLVSLFAILTLVTWGVGFFAANYWMFVGLMFPHMDPLTLSITLMAYIYLLASLISMFNNAVEATGDGVENLLHGGIFSPIRTEDNMTQRIEGMGQSIGGGSFGKGTARASRPASRSVALSNKE